MAWHQRGLRTIIVATFVLSPLLAFAGDAPTQKQLDFFERRVRPVLVKHCFECHSGKQKKPKGGLRLDFRDGLLRGGDSGPAIVPGKPEKSLLIEAIRYQSIEMPPNGRLPKRVVEDLIKWVKMGAPDPRVGKLTKGNDTKKISNQELWSLQPLKVVTAPKIGGVDGVIDRFVRARLAKSGLPPASPAKSHVLLRRLHLDLTGLPPTTEQLVSFERAVKQNRDKAIAEVVDRLLGSADFGERWARHWLDLTAYADTIGIGRAIPALEAWRYRDYVIHALNSDKPFDEFIREQIAGDLTAPPAPGSPAGPPTTAQSIIATGFLAIGPWELVSGDKVQLRMDVVDKQIQRIGQVFLAMTFGCARCHDHKFDPVSQRDYYAMAGILKSTVTLNGRIGGVFSAINHRTLPETSQELLSRSRLVKVFESEVASLQKKGNAARAKITRLRKSITSKSAGKQTALQAQLKAETAAAKRYSDRLNVLTYLKAHRTQARAMSVTDTPEPVDCPINIGGNAHQLGERIPRGFPAAITPREKPKFTRGGSGRLQLAGWIANKRNPLTARVCVNRVWHHLFGAGLVRTVDNFGARGERPSHPALLDYLAAELMRDGWSIKRMIRRIVLTKTWQQAAVNRQALDRGVQKRDPENRLLWRANRRRLEAEAIRDALLFVSGQLIHKRGGPTLPLDAPGNLGTALTGSLRPNARLPQELKHRRSIYLPQKRKSPFDEIDFLAVFDLPDANQETGRRTITTVPTQALYLLNHPFVQQCATATARRHAMMERDPKKRLFRLYRAIYCRSPSDRETRESLEFLRKLRSKSSMTAEVSELQAWSRLCQTLLISNEFLFCD